MLQEVRLNPIKMKKIENFSQKIKNKIKNQVEVLELKNT